MPCLRNHSCVRPSISVGPCNIFNSSIVQGRFTVMEPRQPARPMSDHDWIIRKHIIIGLYAAQPLEDVMKIMQEQHLFKATYL